MQCWVFNCILIQKTQKLLLNTSLGITIEPSYNYILLSKENLERDAFMWPHSHTAISNTSTYKGGDKQGWPQSYFSYTLPSNMKAVNSCQVKQMWFLVIQWGFLLLILNFLALSREGKDIVCLFLHASGIKNLTESMYHTINGKNLNFLQPTKGRHSNSPHRSNKLLLYLTVSGSEAITHMLSLTCSRL